jgi:filamentous hemagglutinin family protein
MLKGREAKLKLEMLFGNTKDRLVPLLLCFASHLSFSPVSAQIVEDDTLGVERSIRTPNITIQGRPADLIQGGAIRGTNLFHSFSSFNIEDGQRVYFDNPTGITNILTRVTGQAPSYFLGTVGVTGSANLFLLNPNGIIFGRNARLDINGSFIASTASRLILADGTQFSATTPQLQPLLTMSIPQGLQFEGNSQILVQGNGRGLRQQNDPIIDTNNALRVSPNQTLALIGGNLRFDGGTLKTAGGRIELGSVAGSGFVSLSSHDKGFAFSYGGVPSFGDIQLTRATSIDASGAGGGNIQIQGRQVTLQGGSRFEASTLGTGTGGSITINALELLELNGSTADNPGDNRSFPTQIESDNRQTGQVPSQLTINTQRLMVRNGARISASNRDAGIGGNVVVNASELIELSGTGTSQGGLRSSGLSVQTRGTGRAGSLTLNTKRLLILNGAEASASTFSPGNGGNLEVNATDGITVSGTSASGELRSRLVAEVGDAEEIRRRNDPTPLLPATGQGGNLIVRTGELTVRDGATVAVSSRSTASDAQGAGTLDINAETIQLDNQGTITANTLSGQGGDIRLQVGSILSLRRNSSISTSAGKNLAGGDGGNIFIEAPFIVTAPSENSDITANAFDGQGGKVDITAQSIFWLLPLSRSELEDRLGTIDPAQLEPILLPTNDATAISQTNASLSGTVIFNSPEVDSSQALPELPEDFVNAAGLIDQHLCIVGEGSEFVVIGRGGLPDSPVDALNTEIVWEDWRIAMEPEQESRRQDQVLSRSSPRSVSLMPTNIVEAQGWRRDAHGNVVLIASAIVSQPQSFWFNPLQHCRQLQKITQKSN